MIFRQFCAPDRQLSYLFADPVTREAVILDPHYGLESDYFAVIEHLDLKLSFVVESHMHESHRSTAPALCAETDARWIAPPGPGAPADAILVRDGESLFLGEECFTALFTPGHSPCSTCFCWCDRLFTGHTLLYAKTGTCNRHDSDPGMLYENIIHRLYTLPEDTKVFPGFDAGGLESTIRRERRFNTELTAGTPKDEFVRLKNRSRRIAHWSAFRISGASDQRTSH